MDQGGHEQQQPTSACTIQAGTVKKRTIHLYTISSRRCKEATKQALSQNNNHDEMDRSGGGCCFERSKL
jgi:hypothetical protein